MVLDGETVRSVMTGLVFPAFIYLGRQFAKNRHAGVQRDMLMTQLIDRVGREEKATEALRKDVQRIARRLEIALVRMERSGNHGPV